MGQGNTQLFPSHRKLRVRYQQILRGVDHEEALFQPLQPSIRGLENKICEEYARHRPVLDRDLEHIAGRSLAFQSHLHWIVLH